MPIHTMNVYVKFHCNISTNERDIASRDIGDKRVDNNRTTGRTT